ncbi:MAG: recombinase family protein [Oscillospiraceae bacterium]|nr:recombinase family protein [Oscillospiraceae bacterium]
MRNYTQSYSTVRTNSPTFSRASCGMGSRVQLLAYAYYRLSREEAQKSESTSISNQKKIVEAYCHQYGITILKSFVDDGWSGGNFERPGFQEMMRALESGKANVVITKDLSRLGRDMRESSYYAEQFFPENQIRYIAIADNFDSETENVMAPFQFAMNEVYLRDGSRKIKDVLKMKRQRGEYCACAPYGYMKHPQTKDVLVPNEDTAPVVQRIFERAAAGDSCIKIATDLSAEGIMPPLKYRALCRDNFTPEGAARASDIWNHTTVKRILKNRVYLGDTILGKSKKVSVKSKKKVPVPKQDWTITEGTHEPLVDVDTFEKAQTNIGKASRDYRQYDHVRKSIFGGIAVCSKCGYSLCSSGTVHKGEREKYWFLSCNHTKKHLANPCTGVNIRYADICEIVRNDLNSLIGLTDEEIDVLVQSVIANENSRMNLADKKAQIEQAKARLKTIDRMITKMYMDNAEGKISDDRLARVLPDLEKEASALEAKIAELDVDDPADEIQENYERFFALAKQYTYIETLDRNTLVTFIDRIEVGEKILPEGYEKMPRKNASYQQSIRIFYKFIGEIVNEPVREMTAAGLKATETAETPSTGGV